MMIIIFNLSKKKRVYCILFGMICGWVAGYITGFIPMQRLIWLKNASWFSYPHLITNYSHHFDWRLILPFTIIALIANTEMFALVSTIQLENTKHINYRKVTIGNLIAGIGVIFSGLAGTMPQSPVSASIGDFLATSAYTRLTAYTYAIILVVLAFIPKFAYIFLTIPASVNGAAIVFMGATLVVYGLKLININKLPAITLKAFSFAFLSGLSVDIIPQFAQSNALRWFTNPALLIGVLVFFIAFFIFSLRNKYEQS